MAILEVSLRGLSLQPEPFILCCCVLVRCISHVCGWSAFSRALCVCSQGKLVASAILQNFHIKVRPGFKPRERLTIVYAIDGGMPVTVETRKTTAK